MTTQTSTEQLQLRAVITLPQMKSQLLRLKTAEGTTPLMTKMPPPFPLSSLPLGLCLKATAVAKNSTTASHRRRN